MLEIRGAAPAASNACRCAACAKSAVARRAFLTFGVGTLAAGACSLLPTWARSQTTLTPDAALAELVAGNKRYVAGDMKSYGEDLALQKAHTVEKQEPFAALLSCADSRVPVETVFDQTIGRIFVTRVAGNIATPEIIASLEYGALVLGVRVLMVLAHEGCGAVKAAASGQAVPGQISALFGPLYGAVQQGGADYEATAKLNARMQAALLARASPVLAELIAKGNLKIVAAYYALGPGTVTLL